MWKQIGIIALIILITIGVYWSFLPVSRYDQLITFYLDKYQKMAKQENIDAFKNYCSFNLSDPIMGFNYTELLTWEQRHIIYIPTYDSILSDRRNMPVEILDRIGDGTTRMGANQWVMGRCGEFSLLYTGLCLANGIEVRLVVDESKMYNASKTGGAGDHMWNEVLVSGEWIHIDPTENRVNDSKMYVRDWNKDVNLVYAIQNDVVT